MTVGTTCAPPDCCDTVHNELTTGESAACMALCGLVSFGVRGDDADAASKDAPHASPPDSPNNSQKTARRPLWSGSTEVNGCTIRPGESSMEVAAHASPPSSVGTTTTKRRVYYADDVKKEAVKFAMSLPKVARIKPACRALAKKRISVQPGQLRKWIKAFSATSA